MVLGLTLTPAPAQAQQLKLAPVDLQVFRPAMDSKGYVTLNSSQVLGQGDFSFGLVSTWGHNVLNLTGNNNSRFNISNIVTPSLQGAVGAFSLAHVGVEIGLVLPMTILSGRAYPTDTGTSTSSNDDDEHSISEQGLGDIMIHPKI
ncbi:MAG TPA: hypothetical protein VHU40_10555, partial [Polyangia bacterium]|nr:hypothetical protein [Polyangia bacterium]